MSMPPTPIDQLLDAGARARRQDNQGQVRSSVKGGEAKCAFTSGSPLLRPTNSLHVPKPQFPPETDPVGSLQDWHSIHSYTLATSSLPPSPQMALLSSCPPNHPWSSLFPYSVVTHLQARVPLRRAATPCLARKFKLGRNITAAQGSLRRVSSSATRCCPWVEGAPFLGAGGTSTSFIASYRCLRLSRF